MIVPAVQCPFVPVMYTILYSVHNKYVLFIIKRGGHRKFDLIKQHLLRWLDSDFVPIQYVGSDVDAICWVRRGCNMLDQTWKQFVGSNLVVIRWFRRWCDILVQTGFQYDGSDVVAVCWFRRGCNKFIQNWL